MADMRDYISGVCCLQRHAEAQQTNSQYWKCDCPCHTMHAEFQSDPRQTGIITNIEVPSYGYDCVHAGTDGECPKLSEGPLFPLTTDEAKLIYDELVGHTFFRDHPMYHYSSALLQRLKSFVDENQDKLRICK